MALPQGRRGAGSRLGEEMEGERPSPPELRVELGGPGRTWPCLPAGARGWEALEEPQEAENLFRSQKDLKTSRQESLSRCAQNRKRSVHPLQLLSVPDSVLAFALHSTRCPAGHSVWPSATPLGACVGPLKTSWGDRGWGSARTLLSSRTLTFLGLGWSVCLGVYVF